MLRRSIASLRPRTAAASLLLALSAIAFAAAPALAGGPPWVSVEMPADPVNPTSRGAALVVRAYICGEPSTSPVTGVAEGIVNGERKRIPLKLTATGQTGVYAVAQQWPSEGTWALTFSVSQYNMPSGTVVALGANGGVAADTYYNQPSKALSVQSVRVFGHLPTAREVDDALASASANVSGAPPSAAMPPPAGATPALAGGLAPLAGGAALAALVAGSTLVVARRRRGEPRIAQ